MPVEAPEATPQPPFQETHEVSPPVEVPQIKAAGTAAETTSPVPFYALDEAAIRRNIQVALAEKAETVAAPKVFYFTRKEWHKPRFEYDKAEATGNKAAMADAVNKAHVMALAENPYQIAAKASMEAAVKFFRPLGGGRWYHTLWHPLRTLGVMKAGAASGLLKFQAENAAQIVGENFDAMMTAARPFMPKLELSHAKDPAHLETSPQIKKDAERHRVDTEVLIHQLKLDEQLAEQVEIAKKTGIAQPLHTARGETVGIIGKDGHEYPAPTREQLREVVYTNRELIRRKAGQGFTRLLAVPTAVNDEVIGAQLHQQILTRFRNNQLFEDQHTPVQLDAAFRKHDHIPDDDLTQPIEVTDTQSEDKADKKPEIPGWKLILVRNTPQLPQSPKDIIIMGNRPEFLPGAKVKSYINTLLRHPAFSGEKGMTLKMWYTYALTELVRDGTLVDMHSGTLLLASRPKKGRLTNPKHVPWIGWSSRKSSLPTTVRLRMGGMSMREKTLSTSLGVRTAVELTR